MRRLSLTVLLLVSTISSAQSASEEARTRFKRGVQLYEENNFRAALVEFQRAYELSNNFKLLYNMGQVQMQLQDYAAGLTSLTRYLAEGGTELAPARREEVGKDIERLKTRVGRVTLDTAAGAEVLIDDVSVGFAPLPDAVVVNTGRHKITVQIAGRGPVSRVIDIAGLQSVTVSIGKDTVPVAEPRPAVATTAPAPAPAPRTKTGAIVLWITTGALAIGAGTTMALAFSGAGQLQRSKETLGVTRATLDLQASRVQTFALAADILTISTVVAGGVALFFTLWTPAEAPVAVGIGPGQLTFKASF